MIKIERFVIEESLTANDKDIYCKYESESSHERMINNRLVISYRRRCNEGSMVAFWDTNELTHTYMIYVQKTHTYHYTNDRDVAVEAYLNLLEKIPPTFLKKA